MFSKCSEVTCKLVWLALRNFENLKKYQIRDDLKLRHFFTILYSTYQCSEVAGKVVRPALWGSVRKCSDSKSRDALHATWDCLGVEFWKSIEKCQIPENLTIQFFWLSIFHFKYFEVAYSVSNIFLFMHFSLFTPGRKGLLSVFSVFAYFHWTIRGHFWVYAVRIVILRHKTF
jgi:hypothetical protein